MAERSQSLPPRAAPAPGAGDWAASCSPRALLKGKYTNLRIDIDVDMDVDMAVSVIGGSFLGLFVIRALLFGFMLRLLILGKSHRRVLVTGADPIDSAWPS